MADWISVKDRLPEDDNSHGKRRAIKVLVAIKARNGWTIRTQERFLHWDNTTWLWRYAAGDVTHWMPLPEPPEANP